MTNFSNPMNIERNERVQTFERERKKRKQRRKIWLEARYPALHHFEIVSHMIIVLLLIALGIIVIGATIFLLMGDSTKSLLWTSFGWAVTKSALYFYFLRAFFHAGTDMAMKYLEPEALLFGEPPERDSEAA